jgi:protein TonB
VANVLLLKKVPPTYPQEARDKGISGRVVLQTEISPTGDVEKLSVVSGDDVFVPAATDAVKQWKYKPYLLNGEPVAVETQTTVVFQLPSR